MKKTDGIKFLFDSRFTPLTNGMAFIDAPVDEMVNGYRQWVDDLYTAGSKIRRTHKHEGDFKELLSASLPFIYPRKDVFFETRSKWTGYYPSAEQ